MTRVLYFGAVLGFIILGLAKGVNLYWTTIRGAIGGTVRCLVWRLRRA